MQVLIAVVLLFFVQGVSAQSEDLSPSAEVALEAPAPATAEQQPGVARAASAPAAAAAPATPATSAPNQPAPATAPDPDPDAQLRAAAQAMAAAHERAYPDTDPGDPQAERSPYARYRLRKGLLSAALSVAFAVPLGLVYDLAPRYTWPLVIAPIAGAAGVATVVGANYGSFAGYGDAFWGAALGGAVGFAIGAATTSGAREESRTASMLILMGCTGVFAGLGATLTHSAAEDQAYAKRKIQVGLAPSREGLSLGVSGRF